MSPDGTLSPRAKLLTLGSLYGLARGPSGQTLVASIAIQTMLVVSGIIAARSLGVDGRGALGFLWLFPLVLTLYGGIGLSEATTYYVARELKHARAVVLISVKLTLGITALLTAVYGSLLLVFTPVEGSTTVDASLSVALIPALLAIGIGDAVLLGSKRFRAFNTTRMAAPVLYAAGAATLFGMGEAHLTSMLAAAVAAWIIAAVMTWLVALQHLPASAGPPQTTAGQILRFGLRGVMGSVSPINDVRADQFLVGFLLDPAALGLYVTAISFCNLPRFVGASIGMVGFPRVASAENSRAAWAQTFRSARIGIMLVATAVVAIFAVLPILLPLLYGDDFRAAVSLGRILLIATFFLAIHRLLTELVRGLGRPGYGSITELANGCVFVISLVLLAGPLTVNKVAVAVLLGALVSTVLLLGLIIRLKARRFDPVKGSYEC